MSARCPRCLRGLMIRDREAVASLGIMEVNYCLTCGYEDYGGGWRPEPKAGDGRASREPYRAKYKAPG